MKYFIADTHFYHERIIKLGKRPFSSLNDMHNTLISNWNKKVARGDLVYILGDFSFKHSGDILKRLAGSKIFVIGSHDKDALKADNRPLFEKIAPVISMKEEGQRVILCHYPFEVWESSHRGSWHLHGHCHGDLKPLGKRWDVGVDNNNFEPLSWVEIKGIMSKRPKTKPHHLSKYGFRSMLRKFVRF